LLPVEISEPFGIGIAIWHLYIKEYLPDAKTLFVTTYALSDETIEYMGIEHMTKPCLAKDVVARVKNMFA
jgi:hypothetical protein